MIHTILQKLRWRQAFSLTNQQEIFFHLHLLLSSGFSLVSALEIIKNQNSCRHVFRLIHHTQTLLNNGASFSKSLAESAPFFDPVIIHLIRTGEYTGDLVKSLERIQEYLKWRYQFTQQLSRAFAYPLFLALLILSLIGLLMGAVIPQLQSFLVTHQKFIPLSTKLLIACAEFSTSYSLPILMVLFITIVVLRLLNFLSLTSKTIWAHMKLKIPILGKTLLLIEEERFVYTFHILFIAGIPLLESLRHAQNSVRNIWLQQRLKSVLLRIEYGETLSQALSSENIFDDILKRLLSIGEASGHLSETLAQAEYYFRETLKKRLNMLLSMIEPIMILMLGGTLVWIAMAIFVPLYDQLENLL